jgi:hypothetical protein
MDIATRSFTAARTRFLTADLRKSWTYFPGKHAFLQAVIHVSR